MEHLRLKKTALVYFQSLPYKFSSLVLYEAQSRWLIRIIFCKRCPILFFIFLPGRICPATCTKNARQMKYSFSFNALVFFCENGIYVKDYTVYFIRNSGNVTKNRYDFRGHTVSVRT